MLALDVRLLAIELINLPKIQASLVRNTQMRIPCNPSIPNSSLLYFHVLMLRLNHLPLLGRNNRFRNWEDASESVCLLVLPPRTLTLQQSSDFLIVLFCFLLRKKIQQIVILFLLFLHFLGTQLPCRASHLFEELSSNLLRNLTVQQIANYRKETLVGKLS
jgi:hypothetical protein